MYYCLTNWYALRGWLYAPQVLYNIKTGHACPLSDDAFALLSRCDGQTELPNSRLIEEYVKSGVIVPCTQKTTITAEQKYRFYENRRFRSVNWAVTGKCNYRCRHCFMAKDASPVTDEFTHEECMELIRQFDECGISTVCMTGGEPLMRSDFLELVREIVHRGMILEDIGTNGFFVDEGLLDSLKALGVRPLVKVSFDGMGCHDWLRGVLGAERKALSAIRLLKQKGFPVKVQMALHQDNADALQETAGLLAQLGADELRVMRICEAPRWMATSADKTLSAADYYEKCLHFLQWYRDSGLKMNLTVWGMGSYAPVFEWFRAAVCECEFDERLPVCADSREMLFLASDGSVAPCNQMSGVLKAFGDEWGNVRKMPLQKLLTQSEYIERVTATVGDLFARNEKCALCAYWEKCLGGCRAIGYGITGAYFGEDYTECVFYKEGYYDRLTKLFPKQRQAQKHR